MQGGRSVKNANVTGLSLFYFPIYYIIILIMMLIFETTVIQITK